MRRNPGHSEIWSNTSKKRQLSKDSFRAVDVSKSVKALDHKAGKIYADLYERCIDFGAHPNEAALYTSMSLEKITGGVHDDRQATAGTRLNNELGIEIYRARRNFGTSIVSTYFS
jgi:hypothetical protein